jgi:hypothetical protein
MTTTKPKKEAAKKPASKNGGGADGLPTITTKEELKTFLQSLRDKMREQVAASIFAVSAIHYVLNLQNIYTVLDNENKEIARDIWLRLKQSGMQLRNPPLLFRPDEEDSQAAGS